MTDVDELSFEDITFKEEEKDEDDVEDLLKCKFFFLKKIWFSIFFLNK